MMTKSWPMLALAMLGAVAAAVCLAAFDWTAWACRLPTGEEGKVLTPGFGGCVEFWLNRYQTLIAGLLALAAAAISIVSYRRQALFAQHGVMQSRILTLREDVVEFQRARSQLALAGRSVEDLVRAAQQIIDKAEGIDVVSVDTGLSVASQRMRNFGAGIRATISGRKVDAEIRELIDNFVRSCDHAADQTERIYQPAREMIIARDPYARAIGVSPLENPAATERINALQREVALLAEEVRVVFAPAAALAEALLIRIDKIEALTYSYEQVIEEAISN